MPERVVSVKMPATLVRELERLQGTHHYLDLSEQLRSIVRKRCLDLTSPQGDLTRKAAKEEILHELIELLREESA